MKQLKLQMRMISLKMTNDRSSIIDHWVLMLNLHPPVTLGDAWLQAGGVGQGRRTGTGFLD